MKTAKGMTMAAVLGVFLAGTARAGSLDPYQSPAPTMYTLTELYQQLQMAQQQLAANQQALSNLQERMDAAGMPIPPADMVLIPAGSFVMGACTNVGQESEADEIPQHTVSVSAFYLGKCEVTKAKWDAVCAWATNNGYEFSNPGEGRDVDHPVQRVSWDDCVKWCNARSEMEMLTPAYTITGAAYRTGESGNWIECDFRANGYRLPTEAEWEKAARGGASHRRFPWGDTIQHSRANYYANPTGFSYDTSPTARYHPAYSIGPEPYTSPAGALFAPNGYGLYNMADNVCEWCWDCHSSTYYSSSPGTDPAGPPNNSYRVLRGGTWYFNAESARCAARNDARTFDQTPDMGFRCARGL